MVTKGPVAHVSRSGLRRRAVVVLIAAVVVLGACRRDGGGEILVPTSAGYPVGMRTFTFVDASRAADGERGSSAAGDRTLPTTVWYPGASSGPETPPAADGPFPVVVFSHGLGGWPEAYQRLVVRWAAAGFVVVAPTYPLTSRGAGWDTAGDVRNQPGDASFVLTSALRQADQPGDPLHGVLDADRVAGVGHSLGGMTTVGLFDACCRDDRLDGGIILAGRSLGPDDRGPAGRAVPLLFVHADDDPIVPYRAGRAAHDGVPWPKAFVTLVSAGHIEPYFGGAAPAAEVVNDVTTGFLRWVLGGDRGALQSLRQDAQVAGIARLEDALE